MEFFILLITIPLVLSLLLALASPFLYLKEEIDLWSGSLKISGVLWLDAYLISLVSGFQDRGFKNMTTATNGPYLALAVFIMLFALLYFLRTFAILLGWQEPFDDVIAFFYPYVDSLFSATGVEEWMKRVLGI